jgi:hypothetical protein
MEEKPWGESRALFSCPCHEGYRGQLWALPYIGQRWKPSEQPCGPLIMSKKKNKIFAKFDSLRRIKQLF